MRFLHHALSAVLFALVATAGPPLPSLPRLAPDFHPRSHRRRYRKDYLWQGSSPNRYMPHQGKQEIARRLRQQARIKARTAA